MWAQVPLIGIPANHRDSTRGLVFEGIDESACGRRVVPSKRCGKRTQATVKLGRTRPARFGAACDAAGYGEDMGVAVGRPRTIEPDPPKEGGEDSGSRQGPGGHSLSKIQRSTLCHGACGKGSIISLGYHWPCFLSSDVIRNSPLALKVDSESQESGVIASVGLQCRPHFQFRADRDGALMIDRVQACLYPVLRGF